MDEFMLAFAGYISIFTGRRYTFFFLSVRHTILYGCLEVPCFSDCTDSAHIDLGSHTVNNTDKLTSISEKDKLDKPLLVNILGVYLSSFGGGDGGGSIAFCGILMTH